VITGLTKIYALYGPWRDWCEWCLRELDRRGFNPQVTSGLRSRASQAKLYDDYIHGRSKLPAAPPGRSAHEYGLAIDVWAGNGQQAAMMALLKSWGGELVANDAPHVQYPGYRKALGS
jgi:peptidoglycan LD-endopeptidase CwlK